MGRGSADEFSVCACACIGVLGGGGGEDCMQSVERMSLQLRSHK